MKWTLILSGLSLMLLFQNCGSYSSSQNFSSNDRNEASQNGAQTSLCFPEVLCTANLDLVSIKITPVVRAAFVRAGGPNTPEYNFYYLDVAGECDTGGFMSHSFFYSVNGASEATAEAQCKDGRFEIRISLAVGDPKYGQLKINLAVFDSEGIRRESIASFQSVNYELH